MNFLLGAYLSEKVHLKFIKLLQKRAGVKPPQKAAHTISLDLSGFFPIK